MDLGRDTPSNGGDRKEGAGEAALQEGIIPDPLVGVDEGMGDSSESLRLANRVQYTMGDVVGIPSTRPSGDEVEPLSWLQEDPARSRENAEARRHA